MKITVPTSIADITAEGTVTPAFNDHAVFGKGKYYIS